MLRILSALTFFAGSNALACPTLTGAYTCKFQTGTSQVITMAQSVGADGVTNFTFNGAPIAADNKVNPVPDDANLKNGTLRAWCASDSTFNMELLGKYWNNGELLGDITQDIAFSIVGVDLKEDIIGSVKGAGGTFPITSSLTCAKNP